LALAIGLLSYNTGSNAVQTVSEHLLKETVSRLSQAIDRHVVGSVATLETAFPDGVFAPEDIKTDVENIRTRLWIASSLHLDPNNYVYYGNKAGQSIGLFRKSIDAGELRVKYAAEDHRSFYQMYGINEEPKFFALEGKQFDPRLRPWFQAGLSNLEDIWTSVYIDFSTHDLVATRARRVDGADGKFEGVVATDMSLKSLNDFVSQLNISENSIAFIVEPNGMLIASSNSSNIKKDENGHNIRMTAYESDNLLLADVYSMIAPLISSSMTPSFEPETIRFTDQENRSIHVAYNKYEDEAGLEWINVVAIPSEDFMSGIKMNVFRTLLLGVLATLVVTVIGFIILHWVTKDIKLLSNAVNKVDSGYLEEPIHINRHDEIGDLAKNFSAMQKRLQTDYLTGLPNRYAFEQHLKASIKQDSMTESTMPFAVLFIDLNDFKKINDVFGHDTGDQALKVFAAMLNDNMRQGDLAARFAGDEFVVMLNNIQNETELAPVMSNLEKSLCVPLELSDSLMMALHSSVGVAYYPSNGTNVEELFVIADTKMYAKKAAMKNNIS